MKILAVDTTTVATLRAALSHPALAVCDDWDIVVMCDSERGQRYCRIDDLNTSDVERGADASLVIKEWTVYATRKTGRAVYSLAAFSSAVERLHRLRAAVVDTFATVAVVIDDDAYSVSAVAVDFTTKRVILVAQA